MGLSIWTCDQMILVLDSKLRFEPKRVVSIVSASRSGSTVFKYALCLHPELCSLAGEEEPYYKLACNGYPWHLSDEFHTCNNPDTVRLLISNEMNNYWSSHNRRLLQQYKVEEPPYIEPIICKPTDTLVLKTPQNCYRKGVIEQLYPEAEVIYIRVVRDKRAIVNGLLDGWLSNEFTARCTELGWWKFDMPPNWTFDVDIVGRSINQCLQSYKFMNRDYGMTLPIRYEDFTADWLELCRFVWDYLRLSSYTPLVDNLPQLGCTEPPNNDRWKVKRPWLMELTCLN